jgi:hypothetical protein
MSASELADWWDQQHAQSQKLLEQWVDENPQWWAVGLATATATAMDLGQGMVDALRLGEGVAKGTPGGVGTDVLRALVIVGPLARGGATLARLAHTRLIRVAVTTKGVTGPCTFTAVNNAATIAGGKARNFFVLARDAAAALGKPLRNAGRIDGKYKIAAWIDDLVGFLTRQGVRLKNLGRLKSIDEVKAAAAREDGVVVFAIEWLDQAGKLHRHSMIAVRTVGGVKFADYGGGFINSLSELASRGGIWVAKNGYQIASPAGKGSAVLFEGMEVIGALERHALEVMGGAALVLSGVEAIESDFGVELAIPVAPAAVIEGGQAHEPEVLKASFEGFKQRKAGQAPVPKKPIVIHGCRNAPPRPDWLTGVQYRLNALGFGAGPIDGVNGPRTLRAVTEFQRAFPPLRVDGIPGPRTQARLVEVCGF